MLAEGAHKGIEVRVLTTDGVPSLEHQVVHEGENEDQPTSTCFLEIEEGKIFKIEILWGESILKDYHSGDWAVWTYVNGEIIGSEIVTSDELGAEGGSHIVSTKRFVQQGQELEGSLRFSRMTTVPLGNGGNPDPQSNSLGEIDVRIEAGMQGVCAVNYTPRDRGQPGAGAAVKETDAKRTGSSVTTTNVKPASGRIYYDWILQKDKSSHRFIFKYRTRTMLEILRVIEDPDYASVAKETAPSGGSKSLKRKRSDSAEHNTCPVPDAQREIYETMMAMRRELGAVRGEMRDLRRKESVAKNKVVDLTGDDSD